MDCVVYRCSKQDEMYLYVRANVKPESLPVGLLARAGRLTPVMNLTLNPGRKLARVDVSKVIEKVAGQGYYLQMPPEGRIEAPLYSGD
jgi:hypothetical protein